MWCAKQRKGKHCAAQHSTDERDQFKRIEERGVQSKDKRVLFRGWRLEERRWKDRGVKVRLAVIVLGARRHLLCVVSGQYQQEETCSWEKGCQ